MSRNRNGASSPSYRQSGQGKVTNPTGAARVSRRRNSLGVEVLEPRVVLSATDVDAEWSDSSLVDGQAGAAVIADALSASTAGDVSITAVPTITVQSIAVPGRQDHVFDPLRNLLYIVTADRIERWDLTTGSLLAPWSVGMDLHGVDITPDGRYLYVGDAATSGTKGFVHKVDLFTGGVTSISYTRLTDERGVADLVVGAHGYAYFTTEIGNASTPVRRLSVANDTMTILPNGLWAGGRMVRGEDRNLMFFMERGLSSGMTYLAESEDGEFIRSHSTGIYLTDSLAAANRNSTLFAYEGSGSVILNATLNTVTSLSGVDSGMIFDPVRDVLYGIDSSSDRLTAYDTNTWQVLFRRSVGENMTGSLYYGPGMMSISSDGRYISLSTPNGIRLFHLDYTDLPAAVSDAYMTVQNAQLNVAAADGVLANDQHLLGGTPTAAQLIAPQHGTLLFNGDGSFIYTPHSGFIGLDTFTYRVSAGATAGNTTIVSIQVRPPVNGAPVADDDSYVVAKDGALTVALAQGVLTNDSDPQFDPLTVRLGTGPQHGTLSLAANGSFVYTPTTGYVGYDEFTYWADDEFGGSTLAEVTIGVMPTDSGLSLSITGRRDHVYDTFRHVLYVGTSTGQVHRLDPTTGTLLSSWNVGTSLNGMDITADGRYLYVGDTAVSGDEGYVRRVDLNNGAVTSIPYYWIGGENGVWDLEIDSLGNVFFTTTYTGHPTLYPIRRINVEDDSVSELNNIFTQTQITRSADRNWLYFTESSISSGPIHVYDAQAGEFVRSADTWIFITDSLSSTDRNGNRFAIEGTFDDEFELSIRNRGLQPIATLPGLIGGNAFDPVRDVLYAVDPTSNEFVAINTQTWQEIYRRTIGEDMTASMPFGQGVMTVSDDGRYLFLSTPSGVRTFALDPIVVPRFSSISAASISSVSEVTIDEDGAAVVDFTVTDADTPLNFVTVTAAGNNSLLLPPEGISLEDRGGGAWRLTATPASNRSGTVQITLSAQDPLTGSTLKFNLVVKPIGDTPQVTSVTTLEDTLSDAIFINRNVVDGEEVTHFKISGITGGALFKSDGVTQIANGDFITQAEGLAGVIFLPSSNSTASGQFEVESSQDGVTVAAQSGKAVSTITITASNDAPSHSGPVSQAVNSGNALLFSSAGSNAISILDVDAGSGLLQTTLTGVGGKLTLGGIAGLSFSAGDGTSDATMTFTGTLSAINTALNGLQYAPDAGFSGAGSVRIQTSDQGNTGGPAQSDDDTIIVNVNAAPTVTGVYVRGTGSGGTNWSAAYLAYLTNNNLGNSLGYEISVGGNQLRSLPWFNVNTVSIVFSEAVAIAKGYLTLVGAPNAPPESALPSVAASTFSTTAVDANTFVATWVFTTALPRNKILLHLGSSVVDVNGGAVLDGEWTTQSSTASGNGLGGGNFDFRFNVLPADANGNNSVTGGEVGLAQSHVGMNTATLGYNYREDFNGSGSMTGGDIGPAQALVGNLLGNLNEPIVPTATSLSAGEVAAATVTQAPQASPTPTFAAPKTVEPKPAIASDSFATEAASYFVIIPAPVPLVPAPQPAADLLTVAVTPTALSTTVETMGISSAAIRSEHAALALWSGTRETAAKASSNADSTGERHGSAASDTATTNVLPASYSDGTAAEGRSHDFKKPARTEALFAALDRNLQKHGTTDKKVANFTTETEHLS